MHSDAAAAIGIARGRGLEKLLHLDVEDLMEQAKGTDKVVELVKVPGSGDPADCLTKYVDRAILTKMPMCLVMSVMEGRSGAAPELPPDPTLTPAGQ